MSFILIISLLYIVFNSHHIFIHNINFTGAAFFRNWRQWRVRILIWIILILRSKPCVAYVCCVKGPVIIYHGEGGGRSWVGVFRLCQNKIHLIPLRMCNILTFLPRWKSIFCSFSPPPPQYYYCNDWSLLLCPWKLWSAPELSDQPKP